MYAELLWLLWGRDSWPLDVIVRWPRLSFLKSVVLFYALLKLGGFCCACMAYLSKPVGYVIITEAEHAII